jgi:hypothetical protein
MVQTIIKVEKPNEENTTFGRRLYVVHVAEHNTPIYCHKCTYDRMVHEQTMLKSGVPAELIEEYRHLVRAEWNDEQLER